MPYDEKQLKNHRAAMARGDEIVVALETHEGQRGSGVIRLLRLLPEERRARGRKWLLVCLLIAPVCVVFPPHIPWPFVAILIGIVGMNRRAARKELVIGGEARCPKCDAFQILDAGNAEFPMAHFCTECRERSLVRPG
jgi:hypothetical protein